MKWVQVRDGKYKYVSDDDARPAVTLPSKKPGIPSVPYQPPWAAYEKEVWHEDTKTSIKATDRFDETRAHEVRTDPRAARWEASRKERLAKDKPQWVKWAKKRGYYDR